MDFCVNPACFSAAFTLPADIADSHLKLANPEHIKVILYIFRNIAQGIDIAKICEGTGLEEYDVKEALLYWADAGILMPQNDVQPQNEPKPKAVAKTRKPDRVDSARRGSEDSKISYILQETQMKFGRFLKENEMNTLVWLYDDMGMDVSLIMLVVQYAASKDKKNIRFIEKTAIQLIDEGIEAMADAEEFLHRKDRGEMAWNVVLSAFGIERRKPGKKELEAAQKWIYDWKLSKELLEAAYDECVNANSKFSFPYTAKIIENWHEKGITSPEEIKQKQSREDTGNFASYDLDLYEEMLRQRD